MATNIGNIQIQITNINQGSSTDINQEYSTDINQGSSTEDRSLSRAASYRERCLSVINCPRTQRRVFKISSVIYSIIVLVGLILSISTCSRTTTECYNNPPPGYREGIYTIEVSGGALMVNLFIAGLIKLIRALR